MDIICAAFFFFFSLFSRAWLCSSWGFLLHSFACFLFRNLALQEMDPAGAGVLTGFTIS